MERKNNNYLILILIMILSVFVRLYGLEFDLGLSPEQKVSTILSVLIGVLSVIGLYFLAKELFDEKIAAISSFLLAISFWHIYLSILGTEDIFPAFALIFTLYFIWHGLKYSHTFDFFFAGLFGGAGFYTGKSYFLALLVVLFVFINYWDYIKTDFSLSKYRDVKARVLSGFGLLVLTTIATVLPVVFYLWSNPSFILNTDNSIFSDSNLLAQLYENIKQAAEKIILIKFGERNLVSWPISIFFAIGFVKELVHWLKRKHGHFSVAHTLIFSWLFVMLVPALLSNKKLVAENLVIILPVIVILSAKGIWWVIEKLNKWNHLVYPHPHKHFVGLDIQSLIALIALITSIALLELF